MRELRLTVNEYVESAGDWQTTIDEVLEYRQAQRKAADLADQFNCYLTHRSPGGHSIYTGTKNNATYSVQLSVVD